MPSRVAGAARGDVAVLQRRQDQPHGRQGARVLARASPALSRSVNASRSISSSDSRPRPQPTVFAGLRQFPAGLLYLSQLIIRSILSAGLTKRRTPYVPAGVRCRPCAGGRRPRRWTFRMTDSDRGLASAATARLQCGAGFGGRHGILGPRYRRDRPSGRRSLLQHLDHRLSGNPDRPVLCRRRSSPLRSRISAMSAPITRISRRQPRRRAGSSSAARPPSRPTTAPSNRSMPGLNRTASSGCAGSIPGG